MMSSKNEVFFANIDNFKDNNLEFKKNNILEKYDYCWMMNQAFKCLKGEVITFFIINISKINLDIQKMKSMNSKEYFNQQLWNSFHDVNTYYGIKIDQFFGNKNAIIAREQDLYQLYYDNFPFELSEETFMEEVIKNNYVLFLTSKPTMKFVGIINNSVVHYPVEGYTKDYASFYRMSSSKTSNIFVMCYKTEKGLLRGLLYKSTMTVQERLIIDFEFDPEPCEKPNVYLGVTKMYVILQYFCTAKKTKHMWRINPQGPLLHYSGESAKYELKPLNFEPVQINFIKFSENRDFNIEMRDIHIKEYSAKKELKINLESLDLLHVTGDLYYSEILFPVDKFTMLDRIFFVSDTIIEIPESVLPGLPTYIGYIKNQILISVGDWYWFDKKLEFNNDFSRCVPIKVTYIDKLQSEFKMISEALELCQTKQDFLYALTDNQDFEITFSAQDLNPNIKISSGYAVLQDSLYLLLQDFSQQIFKFIKIKTDPLSEEKYKITHIMIQDSERLTNSGVKVSDYYFDFNDNNGRLFMVFHPIFQSYFILLEMERNEFIFMTETFQKIDFRVQKINQVYSTDFYSMEQGENFGLFLTTRSVIYELIFEYFDNMWEYKIVSSYQNPLLNSIYNKKIAFSDDYMALFNSRMSGFINIIIYERKYNQEENSIHNVIHTFDMNSESYYIQDIALQKFINGTTFLYVVYMDNLNDNLSYDKVAFKTFKIDEYQLKVNLKKLNYLEKVEISIRDIYGVQKNVIFKVYFQESLKVNIFLWIAILLTSIMVLLVIFIIIFFRQNKKLKVSLLREIEQRNRGGGSSLNESGNEAMSLDNS